MTFLHGKSEKMARDSGPSDTIDNLCAICHNVEQKKLQKYIKFKKCDRNKGGGRG